MTAFDYIGNFIIALADLVNWLFLIMFLISPLAYVYEVHKRVERQRKELDL